jgi:hemerythrin
MTLAWNNTYKIGNTEIDAQHKELFARANEFLLARDKASLTRSTMGFFKYTREHFSHEEDLMRAVNYPFAVDHIAQHNELISKLNLIAENVANGTLDRISVETFLSNWLLSHIGASDTKLAAYAALQQSGAGEVSASTDHLHRPN